MKSKLLNIAGAEVLTRESQKSIMGSAVIPGECHCICGKPLPKHCSPCFIDPCAIPGD